jgi:hypothetical protein
VLEGTLTVSEDGFNGASVSSELVGFGGDPTLAPTPGGAYGGSLVVGNRGEPNLFSLYNVAFNPVRIKSLKVEGSHPDDFAVSSDECTGRTLDAATACELEVIFTPTAAGRRTATVVAVTDDGIYATILVSGDGRYEPKLAVSNTTIITGSRSTVIGAGFSPLSVVTIAWADGQGSTMTVNTDFFGSFVATLVVRPTDRAGDRMLVAQTIDGQTAAAAVQVVSKGKRTGPGSPNWPSP